MHHCDSPLLVTSWFVSDPNEHSFSYTYKYLIMNKMRMLGTRKSLHYLNIYISTDRQSSLTLFFVVQRETCAHGRHGASRKAILAVRRHAQKAVGADSAQNAAVGQCYMRRWRLLPIPARIDPENGRAHD